MADLPVGFSKAIKKGPALLSHAFLERVIRSLSDFVYSLPNTAAGSNYTTTDNTNRHDG